ncbi:MAG TPA: LytTR family transcriptional regulator DNA-binding domain-containing protein [Cyclobacteriaceae bacterium]|nr:LytTR family transcriptional regulator DNA-binding domain-containing protein [Cyclobacteriaceae bacterium]
MIKTILIDDEPLSREIIKSYLKKYEQVSIVEECNDGFEGVKAIQQHKPDLIFLDIQMPKINGFEILELIESPPAVIFTTAFDEYAIRAFESNAVDYLLKPFSEERFKKAMDKWQSKPTPEATQKVLDTVAQNPQQQNRVVVKTGTKVKIIPLHEIHYLEADDDYVRVVTADGQYLKNKTMQFYEQSLDPQQFVRVHRSYIIHINQITRIDPYQKENHLALLRSGKQIPVSKTGYAKLKEILGL